MHWAKASATLKFMGFGETLAGEFVKQKPLAVSASSRRALLLFALLVYLARTGHQEAGHEHAGFIQQINRHR